MINNKTVPLFFIFTFLFSISSEVHSAKIPKCWQNSGDCQTENFFDNNNSGAEEKDRELNEGVEKIFDMKSNLVEKIGENFDKNKKYYLASIKTEIGIEAEGNIGIMETGGESALELVWIRKKSSTKSVAGNIAEKDKKTTEFREHENSIDLSSAESANDLKPIIENLSVNLERQGKLKNKNLFVATTLDQVNKIFTLKKLIDENPERPWWPYKLQLELLFQAEGRLTSGPVVGGGFVLRLAWNRLEKKIKTSNTNLDKNSFIKKQLINTDLENYNLLNTLADHFEDAYSKYQDLSSNDTIHYDFNNLKIGLGVGLKGNIFVAKAKGHSIVSVFYKRDGLKKFNSKPKTNTLQKIVLGEDQNSLMLTNEKFTNISKSNFNFGLNNAMKMAHFFSKKAAKREESFFKNGKSPNFSLDFMEIELELFTSGNIGLRSLKGIAVMEIFLSKR